jgi:hypothetical protein
VNDRFWRGQPFKLRLPNGENWSAGAPGHSLPLKLMNVPQMATLAIEE